MSELSSQHSRPPIDPKLSTLRRLRRLSYLLDNAIPIPGTAYRIGLDPLLGLLPGGGDFFGTALSLYIMLEASRLGVPRSTLVQMVRNILFDTLSGTVPVLGDLVDVAWKANVKNIALLEDHLDIPQAGKKADWLFLALLIGGVLLVVFVVAAISVMIVRSLLGVLTG
jgi:hypothetical protein